jgi:uncharacterized protein DUF3617
MRRPLTLTSLVLGACTLTAFAQTVNLRPGKYETTAELDMPGMKMPPQKEVDCITSEDLKDFSKKLIDPEQAKGCKVSDYKVVGNKLTFNTDCKDDDVRVTSSMEMTFTPESFSGVMKSKDQAGRAMTIKTSAKRIGECTK